MQQLHEINPMLGTRGCRLGIEMPEVYRMQAQAIVSAPVKSVAAYSPMQIETIR